MNLDSKRNWQNLLFPSYHLNRNSEQRYSSRNKEVKAFINLKNSHKISEASGFINKRNPSFTLNEYNEINYKKPIKYACNFGRNELPPLNILMRKKQEKTIVSGCSSLTFAKILQKKLHQENRDELEHKLRKIIYLPIRSNKKPKENKSLYINKLDDGIKDERVNKLKNFKKENSSVEKCKKIVFNLMASTGKNKRRSMNIAQKDSNNTIEQNLNTIKSFDDDSDSDENPYASFKPKLVFNEKYIQPNTYFSSQTDISSQELVINRKNTQKTSLLSKLQKRNYSQVSSYRNQINIPQPIKEWKGGNKKIIKINTRLEKDCTSSNEVIFSISKT